MADNEKSIPITSYVVKNQSRKSMSTSINSMFISSRIIFIQKNFANKKNTQSDMTIQWAIRLLPFWQDPHRVANQHL